MFIHGEEVGIWFLCLLACGKSLPAKVEAGAEPVLAECGRPPRPLLGVSPPTRCSLSALAPCPAAAGFLGHRLDVRALWRLPVCPPLVLFTTLCPPKLWTSMHQQSLVSCHAKAAFLIRHLLAAWGRAPVGGPLDRARTVPTALSRSALCMF